MIEIPEEPTAEMIQIIFDVMAETIPVTEYDERDIRRIYAAIIETAKE